MRKIDTIVVHCSDSAWGSAKVIDQWHRDRGWRMIGYHYVINNGHQSSKAKYNPEKDGLLEIDVYQDATWTGWSCLDNEFIWREPRTVDICGLECRIPSREADLLLSLAHVIFCHGSINLLDFLYMNDLLERTTNLDELSLEAERYQWEQPLRTLISRMQALYQTCLHAAQFSTPVSFPYLIPLPVIFSSYRGVARTAAKGPAEGLSAWFTTMLKLATMLVYR